MAKVQHDVAAVKRQSGTTASTVGFFVENAGVIALKRIIPGKWRARVVIGSLGDALDILKAVPEIEQHYDEITRVLLSDMLERGMTAFLLMEVAAMRHLLGEVIADGEGSARDEAAAAELDLAALFRDLQEPLRRSVPPNQALVVRVRSALARASAARAASATRIMSSSGSGGFREGFSSGASGDGSDAEDGGGDDASSRSSSSGGKGRSGVVSRALTEWLEAANDTVRRDMLKTHTISMLALSALQRLDDLQALGSATASWLCNVAVERIEVGAIMVDTGTATKAATATGAAATDQAATTDEAATADDKEDLVVRIAEIKTRARLAAACQQVARSATIFAYLINMARAAGLVKAWVDLRGLVFVFQTEGNRPTNTSALLKPASGQAIDMKMNYFKVEGEEAVELKL